MPEIEIYSLDLDEELLAHLVDPEAWVVLRGEQFADDLIEDPEIVEMYKWARAHLKEHRQPPSADVLADQFDLAEMRAPETAIGDLLDRMRERYIKNRGRKELERIIKSHQESPLEVPQALIKAGRDLTALVSKRGEMFGSGDYDRAMRRYDLKAEAGPGPSFGHEAIDREHTGIHGVTFLIAYKKMMKSWQMIQCAAMNAMNGNYPWLYSLELPAEETDMRLRCLLAGVPWWRYVRNKMGPTDRTALKEASDTIDSLGVYRIVKPPQGQRGIHSLVNTARDAGADLVIIDQLQYIENDSGKSLGQLNDTGEYFGVLNEARNLSDEGPLYIAHQFGRAAMGSEQMPDIGLAKGSSSIEEVCTLGLGMWANKEMRRNGVIEIGTLIARNAAAFASWEMEYDLNRTCKFEITRRLDEE